MDKKPSKVVVVGDINIDIITPPFKMLEVETSCVLDDFTTSLGGNAINVAAELSQLQLSCIFLGGIGEDAISNWIKAQCSELGVQYDLASYPGKSAGITFAITHLNGERQFIATLGTNKHVKMDDLNLDHLKDATHLHRAGFWYTPGLKGEPTVKLFEKARENNITTSLDVGWDPQNFPAENLELLKETIKYTSIFFANEKEIEAITKESTLEESYQVLAEWSAQNFLLVVHRGSNGSAVFSEKGRVDVPARPLEDIVNPTGSGDVYNAGFIYGYENGYSFEDAAKIGGEAAAIHLEDLNKIYPTKKQVFKPEFLDKLGGLKE